MTDDDPTPPHGRRMPLHLVGHDSERRRQRERDEVTAPSITLDRPLRPEELESLRLSNRIPGEAATVEDFVKAITLATKRALDERSENRKMEDGTAALLALPGRVTELERTHKTVRRVAIAILMLGLGSLGVVTRLLWNRAGDEREAAIRFQQLKETVDQHLRDDPHRSSSLAPMSAPKDTSP
jgi:hypothetical protein